MRYEIINNLIKSKGYKSYLEIGVQNGVCFSHIECENKVGVDPAANVPVDYRMTSDMFFKHNKDKFDCIFIDGLHTFEQSLKDFYNAWECLNEGGAIVFHDTNPDNKEYAKSFKDGGVWCGDVYRTIVRLYTVGYEFHTYPEDHGVTVVTGVGDIKEPLPFTDTYEWFDANRAKVLNFVSDKCDTCGCEKCLCYIGK
jgi:predicted O-methyltransferase YrrM